MKGPALIVGLAIAGGLAFWLLYSPSRRGADPVNVNSYVVADAGRSQTDPPPGLATKPAPKRPDAAAAKPKPAPTDAGADAAETGPFFVDLRKQEIFLRERDGTVMRVHARLVAQTRPVWKEIVARRKSLMRMMYFLGSHRAAESARSPGADERFKSDLLARYRNVIKSGAIDLEILSFEVAKHVPKPDAGASP